MPVSQEDFRAALSRFASGVTIVTSVDGAGRFHGMTVSAFCSVSLEPPMVLVCISSDTGSHEAIAASRKFAVNILREDQAELSERFSAPVEDRFSAVSCEIGESGLPLIEDAIVSLECSLVNGFPGGDHTIYLATVEHVTLADDYPLLHFRGEYERLKKLD